MTIFYAYLVDAFSAFYCNTKIISFFSVQPYTMDISIIFIGLCTAIIGDVAGHLGCFIYLKDSVNAIAFVALGTSVPGTPTL